MQNKINNSILSNYNIALPTVFNQDESINIDATINLIKLHISYNTPELLICGSTGEQHSLKLSEKLELLHKIEESNLTNDISIIFGVSAVWQKNAEELAKDINKSSAIKAIMIGFPPYIKPPQSQAVAYAKKIIDIANKPVILYNNSQRTGFDLSVDSIIELAQDERVMGLKDTSDIQRIIELKKILSSDFIYFIGGENELLERFEAGANGISSVAGNLFPSEINNILNLYLSGQKEQAIQEIHMLEELIKPHKTNNGILIGIKKELTKRGYFAGYCRSPIIEI